jgi:hypothetical protein
MKTASKPVLQASTNNTEQKVIGPVSPSATGTAAARPKKKAIAVKPKAAVAKAAKGEARRPRRSRTESEASKLACRYCGSEDLAPSFIKRCDARCRACFKKRYGAVARGNKSAGPREATTAI